ncbi:MAG: NAD-dependent epimerase/dehydratase family protein [Treponema sp.]|nr:NAD-dependent epimerase/dehydratase family protein [Treponema sp.]
MQKKIVLFGATGLVGAYTAMALKNDGYDVVAVGHRKSDNGFFAENGMRYVSVDIKNTAEFSSLPQSDVFAVIHFAGAMPAHMQGYNPYEYLNANIIGTMNVLEYTRSVHADRIIFSQSVSDVLYLGGTTTPIPADSEMHHPLKGDHAVYSISKNAAVGLIRHYEAEFGIKAFILRLPTIYAYHPNPYYYVDGARKMLGYRLLMKKAENGEPIEIWGNPENQKEFVYVDDFTQLCNCCLKYHTSEWGGVLLMQEMISRSLLTNK